ncbi:MAG: NAD-dependent epimerase/dehydratase family protein [Bacteroidetes bacterium]|nr:NAD-dependent epimerase/dehydratase family protein [Bacteroidota bacterium]
MVIGNQFSLSEFYKNKHILITGASGYIAWNLIRELKQFECSIVCLSRNKTKLEKQKGNPNIKVITGSYQDRDIYLKALNNIDIVYHLASQTSVYEAEKNPLADYEANVLPMQLLLEACHKIETCPIIIFSGTSTQCGIPDRLPVDENVIDEPITTYDFHKLQAERWLKFYTRQNWVKGVVLRLTNVYGPGPKSSSLDRGILNMMIEKALRGEELTIYGSGEHLRDYLYIEDLISAFISVPVHINETKGKHFVMGSGVGTTIHDAIQLVAELVSKHTGKRIVVKNVEPPSGLLPIELRNFVADISELSTVTGWSPEFMLSEGIDLTIASNFVGKGTSHEKLLDNS